MLFGGPVVGPGGVEEDPPGVSALPLPVWGDAKGQGEDSLGGGVPCFSRSLSMDGVRACVSSGFLWGWLGVGVHGCACVEPWHDQLPLAMGCSGLFKISSHVQKMEVSIPRKHLLKMA